MGVILYYNEYVKNINIFMIKCSKGTNKHNLYKGNIFMSLIFVYTELHYKTIGF